MGSEPPPKAKEAVFSSNASVNESQRKKQDVWDQQ